MCIRPKKAIVEYCHELALPNKSKRKKEKTYLFFPLLSLRTEIGIYEKFAFEINNTFILLFEWF